MTMTASAHDSANLQQYTLFDDKNLKPCQAAGVVGRRRRPSALADRPGLSIGHIPPYTCKPSELSSLYEHSIRIVSGDAIGYGWDDAPNRSMMRRSDGGLAWVGGHRVVDVPDTWVSTDGQSGFAEWTPEGSLIRAVKPSLYCVKSSLPQASKRSEVSGFSRKARSRLLQTVSKVKQSFLPLFLTLTYPGEFSADPRQWKRDLEVFGKRLLREFPGSGFIWKLEPQERGAPHFHLLAWYPGISPALFYARLRSWVPINWYEVVGSGDERHLRAGTRVETIRSLRGCLFYTSKYLAKVCEVEGWASPGRFWGVVAGHNIPWADVLRVTLGYNQACTLMRWLRRFRHLRAHDFHSLWASVENPDLWMSNLERMGDCLAR